MQHYDSVIEAARERLAAAEAELFAAGEPARKAEQARAELARAFSEGEAARQAQQRAEATSRLQAAESVAAEAHAEVGHAVQALGAAFGKLRERRLAVASARASAGLGPVRDNVAAQVLGLLVAAGVVDSSDLSIPRNSLARVLETPEQRDQKAQRRAEADAAGMAAWWASDGPKNRLRFLAQRIRSLKLDCEGGAHPQLVGRLREAESARETLLVEMKARGLKAEEVGE